MITDHGILPERQVTVLSHLQRHGHPINRKYLHTADPDKATGRDVKRPYKGFCSGEAEIARRFSKIYLTELNNW